MVDRENPRGSTARLAALVVLAAALPSLLRAAAAASPEVLGMAFPIAMAAAARTAIGADAWRVLPWRRWAGEAALFLGLAIALGVVAIARARPPAGAMTASVAAIAAVAIAPAVLEELVFRGLLDQALRPRWGATGTALATASAFALGHAEGWSAHFATGLALTLLRPRGSLLVPMLAHGAYNGAMHLACEG